MLRTMIAITFGLVLACASVRPAHAGAIADTTFAGDWEAQGRFLFEVPAGISTIGPVVSPTGELTFGWQQIVAGRSRVLLRRFDSEGRPRADWPDSGRFACDDTSGQTVARICSDGGEGVFISWLDDRGSPTALRVQHLLADGTVAPGWSSDGMLLLRGGWQGGFFMAADGAGGAYFTWYGVARNEAPGFRIYRMAANGDSAVGWSREGVAVSPGFYAPIGLDNLIPTNSGSAWVEFVEDYTCSGHGCYPFTVYELCLFGPGGSQGCMSRSRDVYWSKTLADGKGGIYSFIYWAPELALDHRGGGLDWGITVTFDALCAADANGGLLVRTGARYARYEANGGLRASWNGATGMVVLPTGWATTNTGAVHDGEDGFFFCWMDGRARQPQEGYDLYATLIRGDGTVEPGWSGNGLPIVTRQPQLVALGPVPLGPRRALALWYDESGGTRRLYAQRLSADQPVPARCSLVRAKRENGGVALEWQVRGFTHGEFAIERTADGVEWMEIAHALADERGRVSNFDASEANDERVGYRLVREVFRSEPAWVDRASANARLALRVLGAPRERGVLRVSAESPIAGPALLEWFDVLGRRLGSRAFELRADEAREVELNAGAPGLLLLRMRAGGGSAQARTVVVR